MFSTQASNLLRKMCVRNLVRKYCRGVSAERKAMVGQKMWHLHGSGDILHIRVLVLKPTFTVYL